MNARIRLVSTIATALAIGVGLLTLLGYFVHLDVVAAVRLALISLVSLLAAWAVLAGALNLILVHLRKFSNQAPGWVYSLFLVLSFFGIIAANLAAPFVGWGQGAANAANAWAYTYLLSAGGAALSGLIAFFLVFAGYRLLRQPRNNPPSLMVLVFIVSAVLALLALSPWPRGAPNPVLGGGTTLRDVLNTLTQVPAIAGARGLLLGIGLGAVATGLRVLLGLDRPYRE